jgi:hypothetical protein
MIPFQMAVKFLVTPEVLINIKHEVFGLFRLKTLCMTLTHTLRPMTNDLLE